MGLANFHFGWWCNLPPITFSAAECASRVIANWPANHPGSGTAYFRWTWAQIEPVRGAIDFAMIDAAIESANALDETLGFRVVTIDDDGLGVPDWLCGSYAARARGWRGRGDATGRTTATRPTRARAVVAALAARYDGHPAVDHVQHRRRRLLGRVEHGVPH